MSYFRFLMDWLILEFLGRLNWDGIVAFFNGGKYWKLTLGEIAAAQNLLRTHYFFIVTRRNNHLSTHLLNLVDFLKSGRWGFWSHALLNLEGEVDVPSDFRLVEATKSGVHYSEFHQVFDCDAFALLLPRGWTPEKWTETVDHILQEVIPRHLGKRYDTLFDFKDDMSLSCIELLLEVMKHIHDHDRVFARFYALLDRHGKVTPQMLYDCGDFEVYCEARH